jgi:CheY-like chemotaxis protein
VLTEISNLIEQLAGENVSFSHNLDPGIPMVNADPAEVEQVVLALAINARNGMAQGGKLTASTRLVDQHKDSIGAGEIERPGKYVMLAIDDTGCDRTTEDPVSNRDQDGRINLSLAAVRGIIKNAGGYVRFSTEPGKGNSFTIYFPALEQEAEKAFRGSSLRTVPIARTVLVVEDDDAVRIPTSEFLKMEGFKVLQAKTGDEAIHLVQQNRSRVDVLVTDLVMPRMTGREVAEKLIDLHPELKVLYMSGDTDQTHSSRARALPVDAVLRKPFRLETLKGRIHELLGE